MNIEMTNYNFFKLKYRNGHYIDNSFKQPIKLLVLYLFNL